MRRAPILVGGLLFVLLALSAPGVMAPHAGTDGSTRITPQGQFVDVEIDRARGRLYATDAWSWDEKIVGLVVIDLATHEEITRMAFGEPAGLALSPSGSTLAVGSQSGFLRLLDPETFQVTYQGSVSGDPLWDLAFDGEDRLVISLGSPVITCEGAVLIVRLPDFVVETTMNNPPCGIRPWSQVRVDSARDRLYILYPSTALVYNISTMPPTRIVAGEDVGFSGFAALTPDGERLVFSSGYVYDALTLGLLSDVNRTGEVALDPTGADAYFWRVRFIDWVRLNESLAASRYAFDAADAPGPLTVQSIAVDTDRRVAYVIVPAGTNANAIRAVPLSPGFTDFLPREGAVESRADWSILAFVSGGIDPVTVRLYVDGTVFIPTYNPEWSFVFYNPISPWAEGTHHVIITGTDPDGQTRTRAWSFTMDFTAPSIHVDALEAVYRVPEATVTGRIVDATLQEATANLELLSVNPDTGAFAYTMTLEPGGNMLLIRARDWAGNEDVSVTWVLYIPPMVRYTDTDAAFSVEYPSNWSLERDVTFEEVRFEAVMTEPAGAQMNVLALEGVPAYTESGLLAEAEAGYLELSSLPFFMARESPRPYAIERLVAVTYSYEWGSGLGRIYQRQVLAADPTVRRAWVLTFTSPYGAWTRYDPLFLWIADSFTSEAGTTGVPRSGGQPSWTLFLLGPAGAAGGAAVGFLLERLRRRKSPGSPPERPMPPGT